MGAVAKLVNGTVSPGFEGVADAFRENVERRGDDGAACSVYVDGECVLELSGGYADRDRVRVWQPDTLVNVFSAGKPVVAWSVLRLADEGRLDLDEPVASYWPEFGQAGKSTITARMLLCHRAGLPAIQSPIADEAIYDWDTMVRLLEREVPAWTPGADQGYHVFTFGWLLGELVARVSGLPFAQYIRSTLCEPHGIDLGFGVTDADMARVADIEPWLTPQQRAEQASAAAGSPRRPRPRPEWQENLNFKAFNNPPTLAYGTNGIAWRRAVIPGGNAHATGESLARFFGLLVGDGALLSADRLALFQREASRGKDRVLGLPGRFGLGVMLPCEGSIFNPVPGVEVFGHVGAGGSIAFADPHLRIGFAYVTRCISRGLMGDSRSRRLVSALYDSEAVAVRGQRGRQDSRRDN